MMLSMLAAALAQDPMQVAADAVPLPAYLSDVQIHAALVAVDWQACAAAQQVEAVTGQLAFTVRSDGALADAVWSGLPPALETCWSAALASATLPPHDEEPLSVGWTIAVRGGIVYPYPVVHLPVRPLAPLFLLVAPDATPAQRRALREALGFSADEPLNGPR